MSNRYLNSSPLPYENNVALTLFAEERPSLDVVESAPADRAGLHAERKLHAARPRGFVAPTSSTSPVSTQVPNSTTSTSPTTTTTSTSTPVIVTAKTTKTTSSVARNFLSVTTSSVKPVAPISNANALSGELSGTLGRDSNPSTCRYSDRKLDPERERVNDPVAQLRADASPVVSQVVVGSNQSCQLAIASSSAGTSLTWQLTPNK